MQHSKSTKRITVIISILFLTLTAGCIMPTPSDNTDSQSTIPNASVTATTYTEAQLNGNITIQQSYTHPDATTPYRHTAQTNLTVTTARELTPSEYESITKTRLNNSFWQTNNAALVTVELTHNETDTTYNRIYKLARHNNYWKVVTYQTQ